MAQTAEPVVPDRSQRHDRNQDRAALGDAPERPALSRLISVSPGEFARTCWGRTALLSPAEELPLPFSDLLGSGAVDELVSRRGLRTPFLRVARAGSTLDHQAFTAAGGVGAMIADQVSDDKLVRLFADGSTLVLQGLHRIWPPVLAFCQELAAELGHPVQANAYVTPPQNQGFSTHYDVHDVFVLQIEGEKRWRIHAPVLESPLRDQPWGDRRRAVEQRAAEEPLLEAALRPGDCLYLPRGFLHAAQALGGVSTHLTIGVHTWTGQHLADELTAAALRDLADEADVRRSLPMGTGLDSASVSAELAAVRTALLRAVERVDAEAVLEAMRRSAGAAGRAAPVGPLQQLRDAEALEVETVLAVRGHLQGSLTRDGLGRPAVHSRAGAFALGEDEVAPVESLLAEGTSTAGQLGMPLARRLLLAGLVVSA